MSNIRLFFDIKIVANDTKIFDNYSMIKMYTSYSKEVDDPQIAAEEILMQLRSDQSKLKNTLALIFFHYEFAEKNKIMEFVKEISEKLKPLEIAGCMSTYSGINGQHGDVAVSVTMFTSDDVYFSVEIIEKIKEKTIEEMREETKKTCEKFCSKEKPKLIIPLLPTMPHYCGNDLMHVVNNYDKSLMLFGMHVFNIDGVPETNFVLTKDKLSPNMIAMIAFYGNIDPKFHISSSFTFTESFGETVEITDAELSTMKTVNGKPALDYLKRYGLVSNNNRNNSASLAAVPAIITYKNGSKAPCGFIEVDEKKGFVIAARTLEAGAKIVLSQLDGEKTLASAKEIIDEINLDKENDFLAFSCAPRVWSIGSDLFSELQVIEECAKQYEKKYSVPLNYCIAYSGGEICPVKDINKNYMNMVHNYTLVVCTFN